MNELQPFMMIAAYVAGLLTGVGAVAYGFKLGFRASYELREPDDVDSKGLFKEAKKEPAELELLAGQKRRK